MTKFNKIVIKKTENQLIKEFISLFKRYISQKERANQRFSFVLTGGSSPINLYKYLSKTKINWKNVDLFWGDERFVSKKSKNSNFNLVKKHLINKIDIKKRNIFAINTKKSNPFISALDYERRVKKYFNNKKVCFDLILLGMGSDGHIASIFTENINLKTNKIASAISRDDFYRISLNLRTINNAKRIFLWLNNQKKSSIFRKIKKKKQVAVNFLKKDKTNLFTLN